MSNIQGLDLRWFRQEDFKRFSGGAIFNHRTIIWTILVEVQKIKLHAKYQNPELFSFRHFFKVLPIRKKKVRDKSRECHNHKPQPFPDPKRKRKSTNLNKHKPNKRTKSTKISSLFPKRGNRNTKRTEKHKNKMTHGMTYNKSPRRINHKATRSKTNTGTTALERSVEQTTGGGGGGCLKHFYS